MALPARVTELRPNLMAVPKPQRPFVMAPTDVIKNPKLSSWARLTYALLVDYRTEKGCFPGRERLSTDLGVTTKTVDRAITELCDAGLVTKQRQGRGHTNRYQLMDEWTPTSTHNPDDGTHMSTQTDDWTPGSTTEWTPMSSPEWTPVSTKQDVEKQEPKKLERVPPSPPRHTPTGMEHRRSELITLWKQMSGITKPLASPPFEDAQRLVQAECTDDEFRACFERVKSWATKTGPSLKLIAKDLDEYRATQTVHAPSSPDPTPADRLAKLRIRLAELEREEAASPGSSRGLIANCRRLIADEEAKESGS